MIKDLPADLHRRLKEEAQKAHRSMTREAIYLLEAGLSGAHGIPLAGEPPAPYKAKKPLTDKLMNQWKRAGMD